MHFTHHVIRGLNTLYERRFVKWEPSPTDIPASKRRNPHRQCEGWSSILGTNLEEIFLNQFYLFQMSRNRNANKRKQTNRKMLARFHTELAEKLHSNNAGGKINEKKIMKFYNIPRSVPSVR